MLQIKQEKQKKNSVVDTIIEKITQQITNGTYKAGSKLPNEFDLTQELNVSRNSLREAMKILTVMGVIEIKRGDGTYVCSQVNPSIFDSVVYSIVSGDSTSQELLELRQILDEATVSKAIEKITDEEIYFLESNIDNMRLAIARNDFEKAQEYDYQFHILLIDSCKNSFFSRILKGVYTIFENSIVENIRLEKVDSKAAIYHKEILNCIIKKDYANVHTVVQNSLMTWSKRV